MTTATPSIEAIRAELDDDRMAEARAQYEAEREAILFDLRLHSRVVNGAEEELRLHVVKAVRASIPEDVIAEATLGRVSPLEAARIADLAAWEAARHQRID